MVYIQSCWFLLFLFIHITYFIPLPQTLFPLTNTGFFSVCIWVCFHLVLLICFFDFLTPDISEIPWYIPLSLCLISQSVVTAGSIHFVGTWLWTVGCTWIACLWPHCCQFNSPGQDGTDHCFHCWGFTFIFLCVDIQLPSTIFWRDSSFSIVCF